MIDRDRTWVVVRRWHVRASSGTEAIERALPGQHDDVRAMESRDYDLLEGALARDAVEAVRPEWAGRRADWIQARKAEYVAGGLEDGLADRMANEDWDNIITD